MLNLYSSILSQDDELSDVLSTDIDDAGDGDSDLVGLHIAGR